MKLDFKHIKDEILSPGNIFWKKNNGTDVLISKKGDVLNHELIQKFIKADYNLVLEDSIDLSFHDSMYSLYVRYSEELLMRDKIKYREEIIENLRVEFVQKKKSQFEFNHMAWKFFSQFNNSDAAAFIEKDKELFSRNVSIASSYTFCAFLLGYYETSFLSNLYTSTLKNLMELGNSVQVLTLKEKIEYLRMQESFNSEDFKCVEEIASPSLIKSTMLFERYDGSGMRQINSREMNDLEIIFVAINRNFGFESEDNTNIFSEIQNGNLACVSRTLKMLQRILYIEPLTVITVTG